MLLPLIPDLGDVSTIISVTMPDPSPRTRLSHGFILPIEKFSVRSVAGDLEVLADSSKFNKSFYRREAEVHFRRSRAEKCCIAILARACRPQSIS